MSREESRRREGEFPALVIAATATLVGLLVRLNGLGHWPLSVDEYYLTKSTISLFDDGLPNFACGGFYGRGLLQQYFSAGFLALSGAVELSMRIYPLICNVAALWVSFLLGSRLGGRIVGYIVLALMALSLWEIEFSRFARMYAPFQLLALTQVYLLYRVVLDDDIGKFRWMLVICVLAVFSYEAAIFLIAPLVVALFRQPGVRTRWNVAMAAGCAILAIVYFQIPFRRLGTDPPQLPQEVLEAIQAYATGPFLYPRLDLLIALSSSPVWLSVFTVMFAGAVYWVLRQSRSSATTLLKLTTLASVACIMASMLLLGLVVFAVVLITLVAPEQRVQGVSLFKRIILPAVFFSSVGWLAFTWWNDPGALGTLVRAFAKFPNFFQTFFHPYISAVPKLFIVLIGTIAVFVFYTILRRRRVEEGFVLVIGITLVFLVGVALIRPNSFQTRYSFFVYPLILGLFSYSIHGFLRDFTDANRAGWASPVVAVLLLFLTEDADLRHYSQIDTAAVNYRVGYSGRLAEHFKSRYDYRSVSEYINGHLSEGDVVIIAESAAEFYLDRTDFRYKEMTGVDFRNHLTCGLGNDIWSNKPLLYKPEQVDSVIASSPGSIWIITRAGSGLDHLSEFEVFVGEDGRMQALLVPGGQAVEES